MNNISKLIIQATTVIAPQCFVPILCNAQVQDSTKTYQLHEATVNSPLYESRPDGLVYKASADSTLKGKDSFEALRNMPLLNVERSGTVRAVDGKPIEYLINGLHDNALTSNIHDFLELLDSKYLKRIEARFERDTEGKEMLQINIVTKGRLLGYRGLASSTLKDDEWRSGCFAYAKRKRTGLSFSYYNTWEWGHNYKSESEEWRYNSQDLYYEKYDSKSAGYKTDLNNFEAQFTYEFAPEKLLSVFGRVLFKANPHSSFTAHSYAENIVGQQTYNYTIDGTSQTDKDAEYQVTVDYEQLFGENAERGKFYIGYEFYTRPTDRHSNSIYTNMEFLEPSYIKDFYDTYTQRSESEYHHILSALYRRKFSGHQFFVEDFIRYINEGEKESRLKKYRYARTYKEILDNNQYEYSHWANSLKIGYSYTASKFSIGAGVNHSFIKAKSKRPLLNDTFSSTFQFINPYTDVSFTPKSNILIRLSYALGHQVPDIGALNPYRDTDTPNQVSYGNPNLKAQTDNSISLSGNFRIGKFNLFASSTHTFTDNIILSHFFLEDNLLHDTKDNIGKRYENQTKVNLSSKITRTTWIQLEANLNYTNYAKNDFYDRNRGCRFTTSFYIEQELPRIFYICAGGGYNSPYIYMQGKGSKNYYYNLRLDKDFPKQRIKLSLVANSFIPIYYKKSGSNWSPNYYNSWHSRSFHASFELRFSWRFGKLRAEQHYVDRIETDNDIKYNYDE